MKDEGEQMLVVGSPHALLPISTLTLKTHNFRLDLKSVDCGIFQVIDEHPTMHEGKEQI